MYKVIFFDSVSDHGTDVPNNIKDGNNYFTYGWAGITSRKFKEYNPEVTVECWKTDYKSKQIYSREISGVKFFIYPAIRIKYFGDYSRSLLRSLNKEIKKKVPTIIHVTSFRHLLFYIIAHKLKKYPLVVQNNGESSAIYKVKISKGIKRLLYLLHLLLGKRAFKNIDLLYILDERIKEYLPETNAVIRKQTLGVIPERFVPLPKNEAKQLLGLDPNKKYLLYVGKLNYTKRPDILIDIYRDLKKTRSDLELLILGAQKDDPLHNIAVDSGATVLGIIPHSEIYKYLSASDVYILSRYSTEHIFGGIGLLPVEALLCNTPVIGESLKNFPQNYQHAVGFAVSDPEEIKNAILKIIDNQISFNGLREIAIENYSWEKIIKHTEQDYRELIKKYYY